MNFRQKLWLEKCSTIPDSVVKMSEVWTTQRQTAEVIKPKFKLRGWDLRTSGAISAVVPTKWAILRTNAM